MRILHVVPTYLPATRYGGPIHSVHGLCAALARAGHEVHVVTTSVDGAGDSDMAHDRVIDMDGVCVSYHRSRVGRRVYYAPDLRRDLIARIGGFDVVHLHSVFLWPTATAARVAAAARVPYLVSPRGMLVRDLIAQRSTIPKAAWIAFVESGNLAAAAGVHFTSTRERDDARALPLPLPSPVIIPNGVDVPAAVPPMARTQGDRHALYLGRLSWKKNLDALIEALVGSEVRLRLCGPDDEGLGQRLCALAVRLGVSDRLTVVPSVAGDARWQVLTESEVVVLPSHNENFGNVVPEAMAMARPVIVAEGVGARELVERAHGGLVCAPDAGSLRAALSALWNDGDARARMGSAGQRYVRDHLTWDQVARSMAAHYQYVQERARA